MSTRQTPVELDPTPTPAEAPESAPPPAGPNAISLEPLRDLLRPALGFIANVTVLTALLVYFGWRRSETHARRLGIDESVLGMSTREYMLRSVRPVLALLVGMSIAGFIWVTIDRRLGSRVRSSSGAPPQCRLCFVVLGALSIAWIVLPALVLLMGLVWRTTAFILFPVSIGVGIFLAQYAAHLRDDGKLGDSASKRHRLVRYACTGLLVGVCLFWTASNYAEVEGVRLAREDAESIDRRPGVAVYSETRLHLEGPGVTETELAHDDDDASLRYRYTGLRLLEHTGDTFFLVSEGWTPTYGVVFMLPDDVESIRLDLIRDRR